MAKKKSRSFAGTAKAGAGEKAVHAASQVTDAKGNKADKGKAPERSKKASASKSAGKQQDQPGKIAQLREFYEQSLVEMKKVTWPTRKETMTTSLAVLILVVVMSLFLGLVDLGLTMAIEAILA